MIGFIQTDPERLKTKNNQNPRMASSRSRIFLILLVYVCICVTPPGHKKNDTDLKSGTHTPIDLN